MTLTTANEASRLSVALTDENTRWAIRLLESAQRECLNDLARTGEQAAWEGLNTAHRAILRLLVRA